MIKVETSRDIVHIADLGIFVRKESPTWISEEQYKSSLILKKLEQMGSVFCRKQNQRSRTMPPKKLPVATKAPIRSVRMPHQARVPNTPQQHLNVEDAVREASAQAAEKAAKAVMDQMIATLPSLQQSVPDSSILGLEEMIQRAVLGALGNLQINTPISPSSENRIESGPEEPIYIPSNIVDKDMKGSVNVKSETTTSESLDNAADALKKLRKSKPKNTKKKRSK